MPHGEGAASVPLSRGSTNRGYGHGGERCEPLRGLCAGMSVQRGSSSGAASGAGAAALLGRHAGEEARSLLRNAGWPQASAVFSKEMLTFVSLRVRQASAFLLVGVAVGSEGKLPCWVFKNTLEDNGEQGAKIFLCLRKFQLYHLPSYLSAAVRHHGQLSASFSAARHPKCFVSLTRGQPGGLQPLASSLGLRFISSAESHQWLSVLLTSGTFP